MVALSQMMTPLEPQPPTSKNAQGMLECRRYNHLARRARTQGSLRRKYLFRTKKQRKSRRRRRRKRRIDVNSRNERTVTFDMLALSSLSGDSRIEMGPCVKSRAAHVCCRVRLEALWMRREDVSRTISRETQHPNANVIAGFFSRWQVS